jgi:hypothetical protein
LHSTRRVYIDLEGWKYQMLGVQPDDNPFRVLDRLIEDVLEDRASNKRMAKIVDE